MVTRDTPVGVSLFLSATFWPIFVDGLVFFLLPATKTPYFLAGHVIFLTSAINTAIFLARSALPAQGQGGGKPGARK